MFEVEISYDSVTLVRCFSMNRPKYTTHKSFHKMITPQTNPSLFRVETLPCGDYHTPIYHSMGLDGDIQNATLLYWKAQYKLVKPEELTDGKIDNEKYSAWARLDESNSPDLLSGELKTIASLLFYPIANAPAITSDDAWYVLSPETFRRIRTFTKPILQSNSDGQATSATNTANSSASVTA